SRQKIGAVGVQDRTVLGDLVQEVVGHVAGQLDFSRAQQTNLNEVAVPAVHLVEAAAGHYVGIRQVEQAVLANVGGSLGQYPQLDRSKLVAGEDGFEPPLDCRSVLAWRDVDGRRLCGIEVEFRVARGSRKVPSRASQGCPGARDVLANDAYLRRSRDCLPRAADDVCA